MGGTTTKPGVVAGPEGLMLQGDQRVSLSGGQSLLVRRSAAQAEVAERTGLGLASENSGAGGVSEAGETLTLVDARGVARLTIRVTADATSIELGPGSVRLALEGDLSIDARRVSLHAREHLAVSSGGDVTTHAEDTITQSAKRQHLTATLGDISVAANDDVRVEGQRIRMNC